MSQYKMSQMGRRSLLLLPGSLHLAYSAVMKGLNVRTVSIGTDKSMLKVKMPSGTGKDFLKSHVLSWRQKGK